MTSKRLMLCGIALASAASVLSSSGCGEGVPPCRSNCGLIEGAYALDLSEGTLSADCQALSVELPQGPLTVTRQGAALEGTLDSVRLSGTLYQGNEFTLSGTGTGAADGGTPGGPDGGTLDSVRYHFSGRYSGLTRTADGGTPTDGGTRGVLSGSFNGTWAGTAPAGGARRCTVNRSFTGTRP